ncbi:MAG: hypothetical protein JRH20_22230 [Deltaproteobacteria bacterium]|nr:hypothetical protein [Deltaproteobacteria bacterium]
MSSFLARLEKKADDESVVKLCVDGHLAWFVERPDDRDPETHPMGAFRNEAAARAWADRHYPGGEWTAPTKA